MRWCASKDVGLEGGGLDAPTSIGKGNECQRELWASKGVNCEIPHCLERRTKHSLQGYENFSLAYVF